MGYQDIRHYGIGWRSLCIIRVLWLQMYQEFQGGITGIHHWESSVAILSRSSNKSNAAKFGGISPKTLTYSGNVDPEILELALLHRLNRARPI